MHVRYLAATTSALLLTACSATERPALTEGQVEPRPTPTHLVSAGSYGDRDATDDDAPTSHDRRVVKALVKFAQTRDAKNMAEVPVARNGLWLGLGRRLMVRRSAKELADPKIWQLRPGLFRAYVGPFSALDLLEDRRPTVITVGPHPHCASPPMPPPADVSHLRRVSIQTREFQSCLQWSTVDLFLNRRGMIVAITLDLWEP